jgi:putative DNA primase/helicase
VRDGLLDAARTLTTPTGQPDSMPTAPTPAPAVDTPPAPTQPAPPARRTTPRRAGAVEAVITAFDAIPDTSVDWLWDNWLARGKLHLLSGDPGKGKSTVTADLAAHLSIGGTWPDGTPAPVARTLFIALEDDAADTIKPRLAQHHADMSRVFCLDGVYLRNGRGQRIEQEPSLERHIQALEAQIVAHEIDLLVLDPLSSLMRGRNRNADGSVRDALMPLVDLAERHRVAVVGVMHLNRARGRAGRPLDRVLGSTAFGALARSVWMVTPIPAAAGHDAAVHGPRRALGVVKSNLAPIPQPLHWSRAKDQPIQWWGASDTDMASLLAGRTESAPATTGHDDVLALAATLDRPLMAQDLVLELGTSAANARQRLSRLAKDGVLERIGPGQYLPSANHRDMCDTCHTVTRSHGHAVTPSPAHGECGAAESDPPLAHDDAGSGAH